MKQRNLQVVDILFTKLEHGGMQCHALNRIKFESNMLNLIIALQMPEKLPQGSTLGPLLLFVILANRRSTCYTLMIAVFPFPLPT